MAEYYGYLLETTWPSVSVFLILIIFVLGRLSWKGWQIWKSKRNFRGLSFFSGKLIVWMAVLAVYSWIFFSSHKDWYYKPFFCEGLIEEKSYDQANNQYKIKIGRAPRTVVLKVDQTLYSHLEVKDRVKVMYLPIRQEVVRCDVLEFGAKSK